MPDEPDRVAVGRVTRAHGVDGEVSVLVLSEVEERFAHGAQVRLEDDRGLTVESVRPHRDRLLVKFVEVADRTAAEGLRDAYLFVPVSVVPDPPEGSFWPHRLIGCEVVTESGRSLGRLEEVLSTAANDVWVARDAERREVLVPALRTVVLSVDLDGRRVVVREVPGLTAP